MISHHALAISKLTISNYKIYIPIHQDGSIIIIKDNNIKTCYIIKAVEDGQNNPVGRVPSSGTSKEHDYLLFSSPEYNRCWLVPRADILGYSAIRLGERWSVYLLTKEDDVLYETKEDLQLKEKVKQLAKQLKTNMKGVSNDEICS